VEQEQRHEQKGGAWSRSREVGARSIGRRSGVGARSIGRNGDRRSGADYGVKNGHVIMN
jgi:hypothetical protein